MGNSFDTVFCLQARQIPRVSLGAAVLRRAQRVVADIPGAGVQLQRAHRSARRGHVRAVRGTEQGGAEGIAGSENRAEILRGGRLVPLRRVSDGEAAEQPTGSGQDAVRHVLRDTGRRGGARGDDGGVSDGGLHDGRRKKGELIFDSRTGN